MLDDAARVLAGNAAAVVEIERQRQAVGRRDRQIEFRLRARSALRAGVRGIDSVINFEAEMVITHPRLDVNMAMDKVKALLNVARGVGHARVGLGNDADRRATDRIVESDV